MKPVYPKTLPVTHFTVRQVRGGYLLVALAGVLWGLVGPISRLLFAEGLGAMEIAFWRSLATALLLLPAAVYAAVHHSPGPLGRGLVAVVCFGVFGQALFMVSLSRAFETGGVGPAVILMYTAPVLVAIGARVFYREALTPRKVILITISLSGVALVTIGGGVGMSVTPVSVFWGLMAGATFSAYFLFGKWALARFSPFLFLPIVFAVAAVVIFPLAEFAPKSPRIWMLLAMVGVLGSFVPYLVYYIGLERAEASRAALVASVEPVVAMVVAAFVVGEFFSPLGLVGALLVLIAALAATRT